MSNKPPKRTKSSDIFQTPPEALYPLLPYLPKVWTIWECASGEGNIYHALNVAGYTVVGSDLRKGKNFLTWEPEYYDCIVTNPPYSIKDEFLARAYSLHKPFAFLLPLTALEGKARQALYRIYGLEVIFLDGRINFETPSGQGSGSWFATAWFTHGLNIGKEMTFAFIEDKPLPLFGANL